MDKGTTDSYDFYGTEIGYEYRIVLESSDGSRMPLGAEGSDFDGIQQRLQEILDDPDINCPKGWIERRPLDRWEIFCMAQTPSKTARR